MAESLRAVAGHLLPRMMLLPMSEILSSAITSFVSVLNAGHSVFAPHLSDPAGEGVTRYGDWAQANWEFLVESALSWEEAVYLEVYGDGADCNGASSRVWCPDAVPTHQVRCFPVDGVPLIDLLSGESRVYGDGVPLDRFVSITSSGWYDLAPPLDHVLVVEDGVERVFQASRVRFALSDLRSR